MIRPPDEILSLPVGRNQINDFPNRLSSNQIFNEKISLLNKNFDYLVANSDIIDNSKIPFDDKFYYVFDESDKGWNDSETSFPSVDDHGFNKVIVLETTGDQYLYILSKNKSIEFYLGDRVFGKTLGELDDLELNESYENFKMHTQYGFGKIKFIYHKNNRLYVYDDFYKTLVIYDIRPLIEENELLQSVQIINQFKFVDKLVDVKVESGVIYAITEREISVYNFDFNLLSDGYLNNDLRPKKLILKDGKLYVFYKEGNVEIYDPELLEKKREKLEFEEDEEGESENSDEEDNTYPVPVGIVGFYKVRRFDKFEEIQTVVKSFVDDDIVYYLTNKNVYKININTGLLYGYYYDMELDHENTNDNYFDIYIDLKNENDEVFLLHQKRLHYINDKITLVSSASQSNLKDAKDLTQLQLKDLELEQDFVYNAAFQNMLFNNLLLYNSVLHKFFFRIDSNGVLRFSHLENLLRDENIRVNDLFFGQSEVHSFQLFSKVFNTIYDVQEKVLNFLQIGVVKKLRGGFNVVIHEPEPDPDPQPDEEDKNKIDLSDPSNIYGWGDGRNIGALGGGTEIRIRTSPSSDILLSNWNNVSAGDRYTLGIRENGELWAWGRYIVMDSGELIHAWRPQRIGDESDWDKISANRDNSRRHSLTIKTNGELWAWGENRRGQLGDGTNVNRQQPVQIGTASDWKDVRAGMPEFSLAVKTDGTMWSWGGEGSGGLLGSPVYILGAEGIESSSIPIQIGSDMDWDKISTGYQYSMAIKTDGTLWVWGINNGQFGNDNEESSVVPVQVGEDSDWGEISVGREFALAIKTDGTLWAWGNNENGQLGDGTTEYKMVPIQIGGNSNWDKVSAGVDHSLALKTDGTLWGWGFNFVGRVGIGVRQTMNVLTPTKLGSDTDWEIMSAGRGHSFAIKSL